MVVNNNWTNFKNHYELKSDKYNDDISNLFHLFSLELVNENIIEDEGDDFMFQLHYPVFYFPGNFYTQLFKNFKTGTRYRRDDEEHIFLEDFFNVGEKLNLPGNWNLNGLTKPSKPAKPAKEINWGKMDELQPPVFDVKKESNYGCIFFGWLIPVVFLVRAAIINITLKDSIFSIIIIFIFWTLALLVIFFLFGYKEEFSIMREVQPVKKKTKEQLEDIIIKVPDDVYESRLQDYKRQLENYYDLLAQYENDRREQLTLLDKYSSEISAYIWKSCMKSSLGYQRTDTPLQRGSYENALFYELMKKYPNYVKIDTKVGPYYPDIVISIKDEVFIDIEIDEPYVYNTKQETHYISCGDEKRNEFFMENNWFVIRFAECQLINDIDKCVSFVDSIIQFILTGDTQHIVTARELKESLLIKRWTKEGARMMAIEDIRRTSRNYPTR